MDGKQCPQVNYNMKNKLLALDKKHNIYIKIIVKNIYFKHFTIPA